MKRARGQTLFQTGQNAGKPTLLWPFFVPPACRSASLFHSCKAFPPAMTTSLISRNSVRPRKQRLCSTVNSPGHVLAWPRSPAKTASGLVKPSRRSYWMLSGMLSSSAWPCKPNKAAMVSNHTLDAEINSSIGQCINVNRKQ